MVLMQVALPFSSTVHLKLHPLFQLNGFYVCCFLKFFWHFFTELFVQYHLDSNLIVLQVVLEYYLTDPLPFSFRLGTFSLNDPLIYTPVTLFPFWVLISFRQILILFILSAEQLIFIFSMVFSSML